MVRRGHTAFLFDEISEYNNMLVDEEFYSLEDTNGNQLVVNNKPQAIVIESSPYGPIEYLSSEDEISYSDDGALVKPNSDLNFVATEELA